MIVGILGLGYWGPNLVRNFLAQNEVSKVIGCDLRPERLKFISERYPSVHLINDSNELMNGDADIVVIATPVKTHFEAAKKALENGKHIWVEKPFTSTSAQAEEIISIADRKNLKIFVDHTFIYNGAVRKMKELVESDELGNVIYFDSERINLGLFQKDVNVIWDLAPHDLSIMNYILPDHEIAAVSANGIANYNGRENLAHLCIHFKENTFAHFHVNWVSPVKIRRMIVGGDKKMLVYDDMENFEKIKVYNSGVDFKTTESIHEALVQYRIGDMFSPKVSQVEALSLGAKEFISAIQEDRQPLTNGKDGLAVVRILEASDKSIKNNGEIIELNSTVFV
jgi:predicted dehydrogenase